MCVLFFVGDSEEELLVFDYNSSNNRIPSIGETVLIGTTYYIVEDIVNHYKKLEYDTYCTVSVHLKIKED